MVRCLQPSSSAYESLDRGHCLAPTSSIDFLPVANYWTPPQSQGKLEAWRDSGAWSSNCRLAGNLLMKWVPSSDRSLPSSEMFWVTSTTFTSSPTQAPPGELVWAQLILVDLPPDHSTRQEKICGYAGRHGSVGDVALALAS